MCRRCILAVALLLVSNFAMAQSPAPARDLGIEQQEHEQMLADLKRDEPGDYESFRRMMIISTQLLLGRLGYGVGPYNGELDPKTVQALRDYQKQRGLPVTGDPLSFETLRQVAQDADALDAEPVALPARVLYFDQWDQGYFMAQGTWVITNDQMGVPERTSRFECYRDLGTCFQATAMLNRSGYILSLETEQYSIERWDQSELMTQPKESALHCTRYVYRVNRIQNSVTGTRSTISNSGPCAIVEAKELHLLLEDGHKKFDSLLRKSQQNTIKLMRFTPELRQFLEQSARGKKVAP